MDPYKLVLLLFGLVLLAAAWLPHLLKRQRVTFPMAFVAAGIALYLVPLPLPLARADPLRYSMLAEYLTELAVLVALVGAGLRIDTRFSWRSWRLTWRLLAITMPLTILAGFLLGHHLLGYGFAAAALIGAVLAPTDPVLASDVQVHAPGKGGEDPVRFALTSEAGLNDGLAFPFVWLAVALASATFAEPMDWTHWLTLDLLWRVAGGIVIGWLVGYALMRMIFRGANDTSLSATSDGLTALAITLTVYGIAELCHAYGFLAVFVAAVVVRQYEYDHAYHEHLHSFAEQSERVLIAVLLIMFGGSIASGILVDLTWREVVFALVFVLLVRPVAGFVGLFGSGIQNRDRWAIALFGVRGIGSFYYLAFALNHAEFAEAAALWRVVSLVVVISIVLHGFSARPALSWLDRWRNP
jgi:NhaP-type Na+/H+ or K+/H+ antiporter